DVRLLGCMTLCAHKHRGYSRFGWRIGSTVSSLLYEYAPREDCAPYRHSKAGEEISLSEAPIRVHCRPSAAAVQWHHYIPLVCIWCGKDGSAVRWRPTTQPVTQG